jgi:malate dehydrogenase (oxaloacetate-decarboxylating)(NADP+)
VNCLIVPNLAAGNAAYQLLMQLGNHEAMGPILAGLHRPVHILHRSVSADGIFNMTALAVVEALSGTAGPAPARV